MTDKQKFLFYGESNNGVHSLVAPVTGTVLRALTDLVRSGQATWDQIHQTMDNFAATEDGIIVSAVRVVTAQLVVDGIATAEQVEYELAHWSRCSGIATFSDHTIDGITGGMDDYVALLEEARSASILVDVLNAGNTVPHSNQFPDEPASPTMHEFRAMIGLQTYVPAPAA